MSPVMCPSNVAKAVAPSNGEASTRETHVPFGRPATLPATLVQPLPPSRVTCRLPSSVPTQITPLFLGDSLIVKIVQWFSAVELSRVRPPDSSCFCFSGLLVVRSGEMRSQLSPWLRDRNRNWPPTYIVPRCVGERWIGAFQLKRYFGSPSFGAGFTSLISRVDLRVRKTQPPWHSQ